MFSATTLGIKGYNGTQVPHTFFQQQEATSHLAVLLPGVGYTAYMPLLYYPMRFLLQTEADVMRLEYMYIGRNEYESLPPAERLRWLFTDVTAAFRGAYTQHPYKQITLVGKSLGTLAMGHLLSAEETLNSAQAIWLTPLLSNEILRRQIQHVRPRSLFAVGMADPHFDAAYLAELTAATDGETVVIEGANHSLEIKGDVLGSIRALERVMQTIKSFLDLGG